MAGKNKEDVCHSQQEREYLSQLTSQLSEILQLTESAVGAYPVRTCKKFKASLCLHF